MSDSNFPHLNLLFKDQGVAKLEGRGNPHLEEKYNKDVASQISLLYGGSCNAKNAKELFACADVDGGLIGGASLIAEDFLQITNSF